MVQTIDALKNKLNIFILNQMAYPKGYNTCIIFNKIRSINAAFTTEKYVKLNTF